MYPNNGDVPCSIDTFKHCEVLIDLIYNPARTQLMADAQARGIKTVGGLSMLVAQAARAFELFTQEHCEIGTIERITETVSRSAQNIILIGMPSSGKSTVGALLAKELKRTFFDADTEFSDKYKITPAEAILTLGEEEFRRMESEMICSLGKQSGTVLATGGGAVTKERNYLPLHQNGIIVYLERDLELLSTEDRPLSLDRSVSALYEERKDAYERFCDIKVSNSGTPDQTVSAIKKALDGFKYV
jgi:shikimate dehydrogenase